MRPTRFSVGLLVVTCLGTAFADLASDVKKKREEIVRAHAELLRCIQDDRDSGDRRAFDEMQRGLEWIKSKAPSGDANRVWADKLLNDFLRMRDPFDSHLTLHVQATAAAKAHDDWRKQIEDEEKRLTAELATVQAGADAKAKLDQHRKASKELADRIKAGSSAARDLDKLTGLRGRAAGYSGALDETRAIASRLKENADKTLATLQRSVDETNKDLASLAKGPDHEAWRAGYAKLEVRGGQDTRAAGIDVARLEKELAGRIDDWATPWGSRQLPQRAGIDALKKDLAAARDRLKADRKPEPPWMTPFAADLDELAQSLPPMTRLHQSTDALVARIAQTSARVKEQTKRANASLEEAADLDKAAALAGELQRVRENAKKEWKAVEDAIDRWQVDGAAVEAMKSSTPSTRGAFAARDKYLAAEEKLIETALKKAVRDGN